MHHGSPFDALPEWLPPGRLVTPKVTFRRPATDHPVLWVADDPIADAGRHWAGLFALHERTGLYPLLLEMLRGDPGRPWHDGELEPPPPVDAIDALTAEDVLRGFWGWVVPGSGDDDAEPSRRWPGLAPASPMGRNPGTTATRVAETGDDAGPRLLGLVPAARGADTLTLCGWSGPANHTNDTEEISAVVRSWISRACGSQLCPCNCFESIAPRFLGRIMSTRESSPTARRRRLGADLRRLREATGLTSYEVSKRLGWSSNSKISRIENGRISVTWGDVSDMLDLYGVGPGETRDRLIALARESKQKSRWQPFSDLLDKEYATVIDLETAASELRIFQALAIPGLLQTPDYARAIITRSGPLDLDEEEVERRVQLRMERQAILAQDGGLELWVVLDEAALRRVIGGPDVMREQLLHLAKEARRPHVTVQVVPYSAGPHASLAGSFGIYSFPEHGERDVVFVDTIGGHLFLERGSDVRAATLGFDHLRAAALGVADSADLIIAAAEQYA